MHMGERIKEERERLGFSQTEFAALVDATRKTLFNWESGAASPNASALAEWAGVGLDVLYVVTGRRAGGLPAMTMSQSMGESLSPRQRALLDNYEHTDEQGKKIIEAAASAAAKPDAVRATRGNKKAA